MTIAVPTVTGQLGAAIVQALLEMSSDEKIVGFSRIPDKAQGPGIEVRPGLA